tara:strand:- start:5103 stop:5948 length:846 start_codon:yes stop_codon:yes gene_type:complete
MNISSKDLENFNNNGFISFEKFINLDLIESAISRFGHIFRGDFETGVQPDKIKWMEGKSYDRTKPRSMCNIWKSDIAIARITLNKKIGEVAAKLMNWSGTRLNQDNIFWVPPGAGTTGFHQDNSYQDWHQPDGIITCWIALSDTIINGSTLEYVLGSHKWQLSPRIKKFTSPKNYRQELDIFAKKYKKNIEITPLKIPAGGASFHHGRIWHGSNYNYSNLSRYALSTHCMTSVSEFNPKIKSPVFNHYKKFDSLKMDENFFPILWSNNGYRSLFLKNYLKS